MAVPLVKRGFSVHYLLIGKEAKTGTTDEGVQFKIFKLKTFVQNRFLNFILKRLNPNNNYRKMLKEASGLDADIYHFHDPELLPWAVKLKKKTGAKIIYYVHEDVAKQILSKYWLPKIFRRLIANIFNFYEKRTAKKFDFIVVVSLKIKENYEKRGIDRIETITNYPILEYFNQMANKMGIDTNKREVKLIYVGGLTAIRGIKEIVKSLGFIKNEKKPLIFIHLHF
jgi:hypothetical protein